jgi:hypothetical protein
MEVEVHLLLSWKDFELNRLIPDFLFNIKLKLQNDK